MKREKPNAPIRQAIRENGLFLYEIAQELGMHESTFCRKLRYELSAKEKNEINIVITKLAGLGA